MNLTLYTFIFFICSVFFSFPLIAQRTLYSTGMGADINWLTIENWAEDSLGTVLVDAPPTENDHVVIRHEIFQKVEAGYIHFGDITITREGFLNIFSGAGNSDPYVFGGTNCLIQGKLITSSDFHHQVFGSQGDGILTFDTFAIVEVGDDLVLNAFGQTFMNNPNCGAGGSFDDLYFKGTNARLCGTGRFVIPDAIRAWDDNNNEVLPSSLQTDSQICPEFAIFETLEACQNDEQPIFPIELLRFDSKILETGLQFNWATAWEVNNLYFTLERSANGEEYEAIIDIPGAINSNKTEQYEFIDYQPLSGKSYYRLKQTDLNGSSSYSRVVAINFQPTQSHMNIYPNPRTAQDVVSIDGWGLVPNSQAMMLILNLSGQVVAKDSMNIDDRGFGKFQLIRILPRGIYFVRIYTRKGWMTEKLVIG